MKVKMAWRCCKAHTCDDEGAYCTWDMTLSHVIKVEKIKTRLGLMDWLQAWRASRRLWSDGPRGGEAWARLGVDGRWQRWRASRVKIDEPIWSCDDMKWIISLLIVLVHVLHRYWRRCNGMHKEKVLPRAFHFTGHRCVEKFVTGFRIDDHTIKRGKLVCISII